MREKKTKPVYSLKKKMKNFEYLSCRTINGTKLRSKKNFRFFVVYYFLNKKKLFVGEMRGLVSRYREKRRKRRSPPRVNDIEWK
jgi:hypothetical protein